MWKHICLSAGICGSYNPCFTISPLWTSHYLIGAPGPPSPPPLAPWPLRAGSRSRRERWTALQTFVIKQVEPDPPAQEVSNYSKVRRLRSFARLGVNMKGEVRPYLTLVKRIQIISTFGHQGKAAASNWSISSVMVFKNLQTKININWDFMNWTCTNYQLTILHG